MSAVYSASGIKKQAWEFNYQNSICRLNGYDEDAVTYYPILIVGAGESGIAMGCRLKEVLGFDQFRIFDRQAGVGGTWWINRYPGVACDVPAVFYSFSFAQNPKWSSFFPQGPEIVKYLSDVCSKYEITDKIQVDTGIEGCRWLEEEEIWEVYLQHMVPGTGDLSARDRDAKIEKEGRESVYLKRETVRAKIVISAVGGLVEPKGTPNTIPGWDNFEGDVFHSARWKYDVDFNDKNVVVLGTGCSASQFVPRLTKAPFNAKSVTQLMRSPPWVVPKDPPPFGKEKWQKWSPTVLTYAPFLRSAFRLLLATLSEYDMRLFWDGEWSRNERKKVEKNLLDHLYKNTPQKYHKILTPDYGVGCKRRIFDETWFPGLYEPKLELTTQPLKQIQARSVTIGPGRMYPEGKVDIASDEREIPADVIVLANGFDTSRWLHPLNVVGKGGVNLVEEMEARGGPQAYQGTAMDGFPNFFMIFGPNTATGHSSVIMASENMVKYSLKFIKKIINGDVQTFDVKRKAEEDFTADIQKQLKQTVWMSGGCQSWYFTQDGWNSTVFPYTQIWFWVLCTFPRWSDWNIKYTTKGLLKKRFWQTFQIVAAMVAIVGARKAQQSGQGLSYFSTLFRKSLDYAMAFGRRN